MATQKKQVKTTYYKLGNELQANEKCPPQAKLILDTIAKHGEDTDDGRKQISRENLVTLLKRPPEQGGLKTNQTAERILGFYRPRLEESNLLKQVVVTTEVEVEVPDKPAKAPKEAKEEASAPAEAAPQTKHKKEKKDKEPAAA